MATVRGFQQARQQKAGRSFVVCRLERPGALPAEARKKNASPKETGRAIDEQAAAASQNEAEESDESEDEAAEAAGERTTRVRRPRGGMKVCENWRERDCEERLEEADKQGWATASTTLLSLKSLCGGGVPSSHIPLWLVLGVFFLFSLPHSEERLLNPFLLKKA